MFEPKVLLDEFPWVPPERRLGRFGPMPPRKPELRTPALWLTRSQGGELFLVNTSGERLEEVHASPVGFITCDEEVSTVQGGEITYRDVPDGAAVKVDEYDDYLDLDYVLGMQVRIRSPQHTHLQLQHLGGKGGIKEVVLLWANGDLGKDVQIFSPADDQGQA